ncbi:MAG: hypothetical protein KBA31_09785 [Alphaproteobacteria bacterium]|nr:hypothetical protein [Alphaproteobacteria bacterium]
MIARTAPLIVVLSLALVACDGLLKSDDQPQAKRPTVDNGEQLEADIMAGRVEVMLQQAHSGLGVLGVSAPPLAEFPTDRDTYRRLSDAVTQYNIVNSSACGSGLAKGDACRSYSPAWLAGAPATPAALKAAAEDLQGTAMGLWDTVCAKAKAKSGDENFCAIE